MRFELFSRAALAFDVPEHRLKRGDVVTIVDYFPARADREAGYAVEVFNILGQTIAVFALPESELEALRPDEVSNARPMVAMA